MEEIMVCNNCDEPLIWTFAFSGCEYYCVSCGYAGGMFGTGHRVEATPELIATKKTINRKWGQVRKWLVKSPFYRRGCEKCSKLDEPHGRHLTELEKDKAIWADKKLEEWQVNR